MDKTDGVIIKLDPSKKYIFIIDPTSPLVSRIERSKMVLYINPQDIKVIETENEIYIKVINKKTGE